MPTTTASASSSSRLCPRSRLSPWSTSARPRCAARASTRSSGSSFSLLQRDEKGRDRLVKRLCIVAMGAACVLLALTLAFGGDRSSGGAPAGESATPGQAVHALARAHPRVISGRTYAGKAGKAHVVVHAP